MPEMPEVETIARVLKDELPGQTVSDAEVRWRRSIATPSVAEFVCGVRGCTTDDVARRGKFVIISLPPRFLLIHLGMTGQLLLGDEPTDAVILDKHVHVILRFVSGKVLCFRDVRKFGRLHFVDDPKGVVGHLGPEILSDDLTPAALGALLRPRRRQIKPMLLDQRVLAGLGNIYADESLWQTGIHPLRHGNTLTDDEVSRLHAAIHRVSRRAIENKGTTIRDYRDPLSRPGRNQNALAVYGRQGEPCRRCGRQIVRGMVGGRGTHYCPGCQPLNGNAPGMLAVAAIRKSFRR